MFKNKSQITVYGNKFKYIMVFCWVVQVWTENLFLFLLYFPHPLLAALVENRGGPHKAISGVGTIAAV